MGCNCGSSCVNCDTGYVAPATPLYSVQYNLNGAFGGHADFTFNGLTLFAPSLLIGSALGGYMAPGTVNATGYYLNGVPLLSGGSGGTPGAPESSMQFNAAGSFGGSSMLYDSDLESYVCNSLSNSVSSVNSAIMGGETNTIASDAFSSFIGAGRFNNIRKDPGSTNQESFIGAGEFNSVNDSFGFIGSGDHNVNYKTYGFVGSGSYNVNQLNFSFIGNGADNVTGKDYTFIGSGHDNLANGVGAAVLAGAFNMAVGDNSVAFGANAYAGISNTGSNILTQVTQGSPNNYPSVDPTAPGKSQTSSVVLTAYVTASTPVTKTILAAAGNMTYVEATFIACSSTGAAKFAKFKRSAMLSYAVGGVSNTTIGTDQGSGSGGIAPTGWSASLSVASGSTAFTLVLDSSTTNTNWVVSMVITEVTQSLV